MAQEERKKAKKIYIFGSHTNPSQFFDVIMPKTEGFYALRSVFGSPAKLFNIFAWNFDLRLRAQRPEAITHAFSYKEGVARPRIHEKAANRRFTPP